MVQNCWDSPNFDAIQQKKRSFRIKWSLKTNNFNSQPNIWLKLRELFGVSPKCADETNFY